MFQRLAAVFAFLTIFPIGRGAAAKAPAESGAQDGGGASTDQLRLAAEGMPLFPLVGLVIGAVAGCCAVIFLVSLPPIVAGPLTLAVLLLLTGLHHTDGLLDFGDGLMKTGSKEEKLDAMHDTSTGAGGFGLALVVLLATAFAISSLAPGRALLALVSAETTAKASMVLAAGAGTSARPGMNSLFIEEMHGRRRTVRVLLPVAFSLLVGLTYGPRGLVSALLGLASTLVVVGVSRRHLGGLTGDVLGSINDISRMVSLVVMVAGPA